MSDTDPIKAEIVRKLGMVARGFDEFGKRVTPAEQMAAIQQMQAMEAQEVIAKVKAEEARLARDRLDAEQVENQVKLDEQVRATRAQETIDHRRLDIEEDRVAVERARVVVDALRVAAEGGVSPDLLLEAVTAFSGRLLPGPNEAAALLQIEDKTED